jgi:hypothetical protein
LVKELYDLVADPDESYDVAPWHPEVVAGIQARPRIILWWELEAPPLFVESRS